MHPKYPCPNPSPDQLGDRLGLDLIIPAAVLFRNSDQGQALRQKHDGKRIREQEILRFLEPLRKDLAKVMDESRVGRVLTRLSRNCREHLLEILGTESTLDCDRFSRETCDALIVAYINALCAPHGTQMFVECLDPEYLGWSTPVNKMGRRHDDDLVLAQFEECVAA